MQDDARAKSRSRRAPGARSPRRFRRLRRRESWRSRLRETRRRRRSARRIPRPPPSPPPRAPPPPRRQGAQGCAAPPGSRRSAARRRRALLRTPPSDRGSRCSAPLICVARTAAPISTKASAPAPAGSREVFFRRISSRGSPAMLLPSRIEQSSLFTRPTLDPERKTKCSQSRPNATGAPSITAAIGPLGTAIPALERIQPASSVSASGTATANSPAMRRMSKPSSIEAPAPPSASGTQARVSPASSSASQSAARQRPSRALLIACGSPRSRKIRRVASAIRLSAMFKDSARPTSSRRHGRGWRTCRSRAAAISGSSGATSSAAA